MECDIRFQTPFTFLIAGPTSSGKSSVTFRLIKHRKSLLKGEVHGVLYCLPEGQKISIPEYIRSDADVKFHYGVPDFNKFTLGKSFLVILDDLMSETSSEMMNLFTRHSHHRNISVIFLVQNVFFGGSKFFRTISLNCHYILCTKNPRDRQQITTLATQLYPENVRFLKEAFADATKKPYQYLLFDLSQTCSDTLRFRANIFPDDQPQNIIYVPKED
jgi:hypothetical protein